MINHPKSFGGARGLRPQVTLSVAFPHFEEAEMVRKAASARGMTVSAWLRHIAIRSAERIVGSHDERAMKKRLRRGHLRVVK